MSRLTKEELDRLPAKTKKHPGVVQLYLEHDFLEAYALHTDLRVIEDGAEGAIGAVKDWERHGTLQFEFLRQQGLKPKHTFLEVGCGTGRLARKVVPYLEKWRYHGIDISSMAIEAAAKILANEGHAHLNPSLSTNWDYGVPQFDFGWAFSVFIHLPYEEMVATLKRVESHMAPGGVFLFSYVPEQVDERTGLKQFRHTLESYWAAVNEAGLTSYDVRQWPGEQKVMRCFR